jgi:hypothetical protein
VVGRTVTPARTVQYAKAYVPMLVTPAGMVTLVSLEQPRKAYAPMLVTLEGIAILVTFEQP